MRVLDPRKVRALRRNVGLRQAEIERRFGLSAATQSRIENGRLRTIKPVTVNRAMAAYNCKADDMYIEAYRPPTEFERNTIRSYMECISDIVAGAGEELEEFYFELKLKDKTKLEVVYASNGELKVR